MRKFALLCPGQGGQHVDMFSLATTSPQAAALLAQIASADVLGQPLAPLLASSTHLFDNQFAQPLIVAASLLNWIALWAQPEMEALQPTLVMGYSIGELTAHAISGEMTVLQAVTLARHRAVAMQACVTPDQPHRMLAVSGLSLDRLQAFCLAHRLYVAIVTGESNAIIAGLSTDVTAAEPLLRHYPTAPISVTALPVHIASHTPLMAGALTAFSDTLEVLFPPPTSPLITPVVTGVNAQKITRSQDSKQTLLAQMTQTIRWHECMDTLDEAGIDVTLELGPGSALSKMLQARHPRMVCRSVADFRSWSAVAEWMKRQVVTD